MFSLVLSPHTGFVNKKVGVGFLAASCRVIIEKAASV